MYNDIMYQLNLQYAKFRVLHPLSFKDKEKYKIYEKLLKYNRNIRGDKYKDIIANNVLIDSYIKKFKEE